MSKISFNTVSTNPVYTTASVTYPYNSSISYSVLPNPSYGFSTSDGRGGSSGYYWTPGVGTMYQTPSDEDVISEWSQLEVAKKTAISDDNQPEFERVVRRMTALGQQLLSAMARRNLKPSDLETVP